MGFASPRGAGSSGGLPPSHKFASIILASCAAAQAVLFGILVTGRGWRGSEAVAAPLALLFFMLLAFMAWTWHNVVRSADLRLQSNSNNLRALFEQNPDAVTTYDTVGRITGGNAASLHLSGASKNAFVGTHFVAQIAPEMVGEATAAFARSLAGMATEIETIFLRADGTRANVLANLFPRITDGRIAGIYAICKNITTLKAAQAALRESEQRFRSLYEQHSDAVQIFDLSGRYLSVNAATESLTGLRNEEFVGRDLGSLGLLHRDAPNISPDAMKRLANGKPIEFETVISTRAGARVDLHGKAIPIVYDRAVHGFFAISRDVTDERRAEHEIVEQSKRIQELYLLAASAESSSDEQIESALLLGCTRLGFAWAFHGAVRDAMVTLEASVGAVQFERGETRPLETMMLRHAVASGDLFVVDDLSTSVWRDEPAARAVNMGSYVAVPIVVSGNLYGAMAFADVRPRARPLSRSDRDFVRLIAALAGSAIERAQQRAKLDALAFFDALTGLPNRASLDGYIDEAILTARATDREFALLYVDLDGFKAINDSYGHAVGDDVLREVAARLRAQIHPTEMATRLGGDEFVVLMPDIASRHDASDRAEGILAALRAPLHIAGTGHTLGGSVGVAIFPHDGTVRETLVAHADQALYRAKTLGRDRFEFFGNLGAQRLERS